MPRKYNGPTWSDVSIANGTRILFSPKPSFSTKYQLTVRQSLNVSHESLNRSDLAPFAGISVSGRHFGECPLGYKMFRYIRKGEAMLPGVIAEIARQTLRGGTIERVKKVIGTHADKKLYGYEFCGYSSGCFVYGIPLTEKPGWKEIELASMMELIAKICQTEVEVMEIDASDFLIPAYKNM